MSLLFKLLYHAGNFRVVGTQITTLNCSPGTPYASRARARVLRYMTWNYYPRNFRVGGHPNNNTIFQPGYPLRIPCPGTSLTLHDLTSDFTCPQTCLVPLNLLRKVPVVSLYPLHDLCPGTGRVRGTRKSRKGYQTITYVEVWYPLRDFLVPLTRPVPRHRPRKGYKETSGAFRSRLNCTCFARPTGKIPRMIRCRSCTSQTTVEGEASQLRDT